ncbi:hypothetical protein [Clostridium sp. DL1XJH146]
MLGKKYDYAAYFTIEIAEEVLKEKGIAIVVTDGINIQLVKEDEE